MVEARGDGSVDVKNREIKVQESLVLWGLFNVEILKTDEN